MPNLPQDERADVLSVLKRIGRTRYGDGQDWTDEERIRYWSKMALEYRGLARDLHARLTAVSGLYPAAPELSSGAGDHTQTASGASPMQPGLNAEAPVSSRGGSGFNAGGAPDERDTDIDLLLTLVRSVEDEVGGWDGDAADIIYDISRRVERRAALSRAPAGPDPDAQGGWRDISSAPKDGTKVLIYGEFYNPMPTIPEWEPLGAPEVSYFCNDVWNGPNAGTHDEYITYRPTHWMPLPTPPAAPPADPEGKRP